MRGGVGGLLQGATQMKASVLSALHFITEAWKLITPTTIKNFVKISEEEEDYWHILRSLVV
jgi:hypothetical protein